MADTFYDRISANQRNSYLLILLVFVIVLALIASLSYILFGDSTLAFIIGLVFSVLYVVIVYYFANRAVLAIAGAREAQRGEFPYPVNLVEGLALAAGILPPKIYVIDDPAINAFSLGVPRNCMIVFTTGLLQTMNRQELEGVAAHEMAHIKNYDSRLATLMIALVGLVAILSDIGLYTILLGGGRRVGGGRDRRGGNNIIIELLALFVVILAPIATLLVRMALSREREYLADATGAQLTRYPAGLASALEKIRDKGSVLQHPQPSIAPLYFANPLSGVLSTHPPIEERIKRLRAM